MKNLLLEGGDEFHGVMSEPDMHALDLAGGLHVPIAILPTAAAPDRNDKRAGGNGASWFRSLGASRVDVVPVIDRASAEEAALAGRIRSARFIYLLGGFPRYLGETLHNSRAWQAAREANEAGAVIGGSSAGAMVLCEYYYDPEGSQLLPGLNLLPDSCVLPHHNKFGRKWVGRIREELPHATLIGIDEQTGMLKGTASTWAVYGRGEVRLYRPRETAVYRAGQTFALDQEAQQP